MYKLKSFESKVFIFRRSLLRIKPLYLDFIIRSFLSFKSNWVTLNFFSKFEFYIYNAIISPPTLCLWMEIYLYLKFHPFEVTFHSWNELLLSTFELRIDLQMTVTDLQISETLISTVSVIQQGIIETSFLSLIQKKRNDIDSKLITHRLNKRGTRCTYNVALRFV